MKSLKIPTNWTTEQADSVYRFLQEMQNSIWKTYNNELQHHYRTLNSTTTTNVPTKGLEDEFEQFDDDMPF